MKITRTTFGPLGLSKLLLRITADSGQPGPTTVLTAGVHGDEYTGVGTLHTLLDSVTTRLECGVIHLYPALNPQGVQSGTRRVPDDDEDLNRLFPLGSNEGLAGMLAESIWRDVEAQAPGVLIDLHADSGRSIPYAILDRPMRLSGPTRARLQAELDRLGLASGLTVLREYPDDRYERYNLHHSLSGAFVNTLQRPALTLEVGPCGFLEDEAISTQRDAVWGVLHAIGHGGSGAAVHSTRLTDGPWRREAGPRTRASGLLYHVCVPGQLLSVGTPIADVRSVDGRVIERLISECEAYVISLRNRGAVSSETVTATLAVLDRP